MSALSRISRRALGSLAVRICAVNGLRSPAWAAGHRVDTKLRVMQPQ
jgi:hypothetical protein